MDPGTIYLFKSHLCPETRKRKCFRLPRKCGLLDTKIKHIQKEKKNDQLYNKLLINEKWTVRVDLDFKIWKLVEIVDNLETVDKKRFLKFFHKG